MFKKFFCLLAPVFCLLFFLVFDHPAGAKDRKKKEKDPFEASTGGVFLYSNDAEKKMGQDVKQEVLKQYKVCDDSELVSYVRRIGAKVAAYADRQNVTYEFYVLDDPLINAFALPGGTIFITTGILTVMDNEAELAGVLGHEITHIVERHSMKQMQGAQLLDFGLRLLNKGQEAPLGYQIAADLLVFKPYGRGDESRADAHGLKYSYEAGYKADEVAHVFEELQKRDKDHIPAFLRSHPVDAVRIKQINELWGVLQTREDIRPGATPLMVNADEYGKIANSHTYRTQYPKVRDAFGRVTDAIGRKDIDGVMKEVDKEFKSAWMKMDREGYKKYFTERFAAYDKVAITADFKEFRFLEKDLISAICDVTETLTASDGETDQSAQKEVLSFTKRGEDWKLSGLEDSSKW